MLLCGHRENTGGRLRAYAGGLPADASICGNDSRQPRRQTGRTEAATMRALSHLPLKLGLPIGPSWLRQRQAVAASAAGTDDAAPPDPVAKRLKRRQQRIGRPSRPAPDNRPAAPSTAASRAGPVPVIRHSAVVSALASPLQARRARRRRSSARPKSGSSSPRPAAPPKRPASRDPPPLPPPLPPALQTNGL